MILRLYVDVSSLKIKLSEAKSYEQEHIKAEFIDQDKWNGHNFLLKCFQLITLSSIAPTGTK